MGLLNFFKSRPSANLVRRLPTGSFTVDSTGEVVISTLSQACSAEQVQEIGRLAIATFQSARQARLPVHELVVNYASLKVTARELRGGAIVFLSPRSLV